MPDPEQIGALADTSNIDWSRYNQPFGQLTDPNPVAYQTAAGPIYQADVNRAMDIGMGFSGGGLTTKPLGSVLSPIRAYHGSPYDFERFDLSKIGTGEGAQAYGHGLYFAESEPVARSYRDMLSGPLGLQAAPDAPPELQKILAALPSETGASTLDQAIAKLAERRDQAIKKSQDIYESPHLMPDADMWAQLAQAKAVEHQNRIDLLNQHRDKLRSSGHMYEVGIHADPAHFLDWDKLLSQQSSHVNEALKSILRDRERLPSEWITSSPGAETRMGEAGIPGIRYLDQGSRGVPTVNGRVQAAGPGKFNIVDDFGIQAGPFPTLEEAQQYLGVPKQTSNYVVFNPDIIQILRKYGIVGAPAGAAGMSALAAQDQYDAQP